MLEKTFLYRVFRKDKFLFCFFAVFISIQLFVTISGQEIGPFFFFGKYSDTHKANENYSVYRISVDENTVQAENFYDAQREIVYNTLARYDELSHKDHDRTQDTSYQKWLFQYIADMRMLKTPEMTVYKDSMKYTIEGTVIPAIPERSLFKLRYD